MAIFRVKHEKDYMVMSNHHLRDPALSLKAKGLLSQMLALPDDWDYSIAGLAYINREGERAVRSAINELEQARYLQRRLKRDTTGRIVDTEYMVYEQPLCQNAAVGYPPADSPPLETSTELNKDKQSKDKTNIDIPNPILSGEEGMDRKRIMLGMSSSSKKTSSTIIRQTMLLWTSPCWMNLWPSLWKPSVPSVRRCALPAMIARQNLSGANSSS